MMKCIKDFKEGDKIFDIYLCKHKTSAVTKNGKPYETATLQDKTGTIEAKIWDPNNAGIADFEAMDYVEVYGDVNSFQGMLQLNVKRTRVARTGEYDPKNYLPVSAYNIDEMYGEVIGYIKGISNPYLQKLCQKLFIFTNSPVNDSLTAILCRPDLSAEYPGKAPEYHVSGAGHIPDSAPRTGSSSCRPPLPGSRRTGASAGADNRRCPCEYNKSGKRKSPPASQIFP